MAVTEKGGPRARSALKSFGLIVVIVGVVGVCVRLGMWQLDRHAERAGRNAMIQARLEAAVIDLSGSRPVDSLEFRRAQAAGVFDRSREIVQLGRAVNGVPAIYVATPLIISYGRAILVERGWVASPDARSVDVRTLDEPDTTLVTGVLLRSAPGSPPSDTTWPLYVRRADPAVLAPLFPYSLDDLVLRRTARPPGAAARLGLAPVPQLTRGPHLSYAFQWFAFAAIAVIGPLIASGVFKRRSRPR